MEKKQRSVSEVIEHIGYGPSQILTGVLVNGSWLADGCELLVLSSINTVLATEWNLSSLEQGLLLSSVYVGVLLGNVFSGWVGDSMGRRKAVLLCFPIIAVLSGASAAANGFLLLLPMRFFVGFGFGLGQPSALAILMEVSPSRYRPVNQALAQIAFAVGELYCCLVMWFDDPTMKQLHWRPLLIANAVPAVVFFLLSASFLKESPVFSAAAGNLEEAHQTLHDMMRMNGKADLDLEFEGPRPRTSLGLGRVLELPRGRTVALCLVCFCYNITIYGAFNAFPQLMPRLMKTDSEQAVLELAKGALLEIPADLVGLALAFMLPRKWVLYIYFIGMAVSALLFTSPQEELVFAGYYGCKFFPQTGSIAFFVLIAESFDVSVRATGAALVLGLGRLGATLAPLVYELMLKSFQTHLAFFRMSAVLMVLSLALTGFIPETASRGESAPLRDDLRLSHGTMDGHD